MMVMIYWLTVGGGIADQVVFTEVFVDDDGSWGGRGRWCASQRKAGVVLCLAALHEAARALSFRHGLLVGV